MKYKTTIQLTLCVFFLITIFFFYYNYFTPNKNRLVIENKNNNPESSKLESNLIKDMDYQVIDDNGNKYFIYSKYGEISSDDPDIILMENVVARIELFEKDTIYINSLLAKYNVINYETNFNKTVKLKYLDHEILAENIDLSFKKNFVWLYKDVIYKSPNYELFADKIEIDLITKNSKIYKDNGKKVKIIKK